MRTHHGILAWAFALGLVLAGQGPEASAQLTIDSSTRSKVIDDVTQKLQQEYIFPETAAAMDRAIRDYARDGRYAKITEGEALAETLTADLRTVSHDSHLKVHFSADVLPEDLEEPDTPEQQEARRSNQAKTNFGLLKAERLRGNIGFLDLDYLADPRYGGETAVAAMNFLSHADALIIDLRYCPGGNGRMVRLLLSYLFDSEPVHLNDYQSRGGEEILQSWTLAYVPGTHLAGKPVYVLTSSRTFSAAEELAYDLQSLKRATIVGETTRGGAHPVARFRLSDHFGIQIPVTRAVNPTTGTNWEGVGVKPEIEVPAGDALIVAQRAALEELLRDSPDDPLTQERRTALEELTSRALPSASAE